MYAQVATRKVNKCKTKARPVTPTLSKVKQGISLVEGRNTIHLQRKAMDCDPPIRRIIQRTKMPNFKVDQYYKKNVFNWLMDNYKPSYKMTDKFKKDHLISGNATAADALKASQARGDNLTDGQVGTYSWIRESEESLLKILNEAKRESKIPRDFRQKQQLQTKVTCNVETIKVKANGSKNKPSKIVSMSFIERTEKQQEFYIVGGWDVLLKNAEVYHYGAVEEPFGVTDSTIAAAKTIW